VPVTTLLLDIPKILSPELLKVLAEMGHGDEIVIADGNFPSASVANATATKILVRADGHGIPPLLEAIIKLFPLDLYVESPVSVMELVPSDVGVVDPVIWEEYRSIVQAAYPAFTDFEHIERFAFYERAKKAYAIVATGEPALYANIILKKGVVKR